MPSSLPLPLPGSFPRSLVRALSDPIVDSIPHPRFSRSTANPTLPPIRESEIVGRIAERVISYRLVHRAFHPKERKERMIFSLPEGIRAWTTTDPSR